MLGNSLTWQYGEPRPIDKPGAETKREEGCLPHDLQMYTCTRPQFVNYFSSDASSARYKQQAGITLINRL